MRLEDWSVYNECLVGRIYGNPKFNDGDRIITSRIKTLDLSALRATTQNSTYELGESQKNSETICAKPDFL